ncbi:MAG: ComF family protein [Chitinispirillaceae bacterium]
MKFSIKKTGGVSIRRAARFLSPIHSFIFPPLCLLCNEPRSGKNKWLCESCMKSLYDKLAGRHACPKCGQNLHTKSCTCEIVWDHPFDCCYSLFDFDDLIKNAAHQFKYKGFRDFAFFLGQTFADSIPAGLFDDVELIVPVPLHFVRKMKRGYNQAEFFARGIHTGISHEASMFPNALYRKKNTRTQTKLDKEERQKNLQNAFGVKEKYKQRLTGRGVLLVDDIVTTGATTGECTEALLEAGARLVKVLSFARD